MTVRELAERPGPSASRRAAMAGNKKPGPKTLCTPKMVRALSAEIKRGASIKAACGAAGIDSKSLRDWRANAEKGIEPYASIFPPLKKALSAAVGQAEMRVYAGKMGWQASARWLESISPNPWRRTDRREVHDGVQPIPVDMNLGAELLRKMIGFAGKPGVPGLGVN